MSSIARAHSPLTSRGSRCNDILKKMYGKRQRTIRAIGEKHAHVDFSRECEEIDPFATGDLPESFPASKKAARASQEEVEENREAKAARESNIAALQAMYAGIDSATLDAETAPTEETEQEFDARISLARDILASKGKTMREPYRNYTPRIYTWLDGPYLADTERDTIHDLQSHPHPAQLIRFAVEAEQNRNAALIHADTQRGEELTPAAALALEIAGWTRKTMCIALFERLDTLDRCRAIAANLKFDLPAEHPAQPEPEPIQPLTWEQAAERAFELISRIEQRIDHAEKEETTLCVA